MTTQNISKHFTYAEMTVTGQRLNNAPNAAQLANLIKAAAMMEKVRALLGHPIKINSGFRSVPVNRAVGGVATSDHCLGYAVDFTCPGFGTPFEVATAIAASGIVYDQLIQEAGSWVHISCNPKARQQNLTMHGGAYVSGIRPPR